MAIENKVNKEWVWLSLFFGLIGSFASCAMGKCFGEMESKPVAAYMLDNKIVVEQQNGLKYIVEKQQNEVYKVEQIPYPKKSGHAFPHR
jgi:hypothetical protein